jgi:hypothetical protein
MLARLLAVAVVLTAMASPTVRADDCPDQRASDVPGHVQESKKYQRCGFGFQLFGWDLDLLGEKCPKWIKYYPDHQECKGEELVGHRCVIDELLEIVRVKCDCASATIIFDTGLAFPECDCVYGGSAGAIQNFETEECEPK